MPIFQPLKRTRAHGGVGDGGYAGVEKKKVARGRIGMEMGMERWVLAWMLQGWDGVMARNIGVKSA